MKYRIGDRVKLKTSLVVGDRYSGLTFFDSMKKEVEEKILLQLQMQE